MLWQRVKHGIQRWFHGRDFAVWHDPSYRLPLTSLASQQRLEPRRAEYSLWYLLHSHAIQKDQIKTPSKIAFRDLARVHGVQYLESLHFAETLAPIFGVDSWDIPIEQLIYSYRMACGGTVDGARFALKTGGVAFNLLGGFHHASPDKGNRLCPINDIVVAIRAVREDGFEGQIVILDLDAHPPGGTDECLGDIPNVWMGSLSSVDDGPLPHTDETVLPKDCDDETYLTALKGLLDRMPSPELAFVIAGGDVLADDQKGGLGLTLDGVQARDVCVENVLSGVPSVWVPGGGYHKDAWKILAGTGYF